jgi:hypothetical protein
MNKIQFLFSSAFIVVKSGHRHSTGQSTSSGKLSATPPAEPTKSEDEADKEWIL